MDYSKCLAEAAKNKGFREAFIALGKGGEEAIKEGRGEEARPYVSKLGWAYFEAYRSILAFYVARLMQIQGGMAEDFTDHETVKKIAIAALPHHSDAILKFGADLLYIYVDELEERLLDEFAAMLAGKDDDILAVKQAATILEEAKLYKASGNLKVDAISDALQAGGASSTAMVPAATISPVMK
ncbi:hypothetical protein LPN04_00970 [Rugamonas sp. A1-17]|nr:hypothetical protein [Rugamonas sp. A1-17]